MFVGVTFHGHHVTLNGRAVKSNLLGLQLQSDMDSRVYFQYNVGKMQEAPRRMEMVAVSSDWKYNGFL